MYPEYLYVTKNPFKEHLYWKWDFSLRGGVRDAGERLLPKDTLAGRIGETGIEPPTFWLVEGREIMNSFEM